MLLACNESDQDAPDLEEGGLQRDIKDVTTFLVGLVRKGVAKSHIIDVARVMNRFFQVHLPAASFPHTWHLLQKNAAVFTEEVGHTFVIKCEGCGHYTQEPEGYTSQTGTFICNIFVHTYLMYVYH